MDQPTSPGETEREADGLTPPPLKTDPRFGCYPWWPEDGDAWVHPEDIELARQTIPGPRVWRVEQGVSAPGPDALVTLIYGADRVRVRPRLWQETPAPEFTVGDLVEVLPHGMQNDPMTGRVREVHWDDHARVIRYQIDAADRLVETWFTAKDLKPVEPAKAEPMIRVEPSPLDGTVDQMVEGLEVDNHRRPSG